MTSNSEEEEEEVKEAKEVEGFLVRVDPLIEVETNKAEACIKGNDTN